MTEPLSYKSLISFMLDSHYTEGAKSVLVWRGWGIDWDAIRAAGFGVAEQGDDYIVSWDDNAILAREAASVGFLFVDNDVEVE